MYQNNLSETIAALKRNTALYVQLVSVLDELVNEESHKLHKLCEQSLLDSSLRDTAIMQLGKVDFLRNIQTYLQRSN